MHTPHLRTASTAIVVASGALVVVRSGADEKPPTHEWREVGTNHWQIVTAAGEAPEVTDASEGNRGDCPPGMIEVKGRMRITWMGDELQKSVCSKWINRNFPERCASFDEGRWKVIRDKLATRDMHFCIDRFEYPNRKGEYPVIYVNWFDSEKLCEEGGKRLCTEDEWTFACEGEEALPYPYGYERDAEACLVDKPWRWFDPAAYGGKKDALVRELDRLWQGVPAGALSKCVSPFGVHDMTGNVDEWVINESGKPGILHSELATAVIGLPLSEFLVRLKAKDKQAVDFRGVILDLDLRGRLRRGTFACWTVRSSTPWTWTRNISSASNRTGC